MCDMYSCVSIEIFFREIVRFGGLPKVHRNAIELAKYVKYDTKRFMDCAHRNYNKLNSNAWRFVQPILHFYCIEMIS